MLQTVNENLSTNAAECIINTMSKLCEVCCVQVRT